MYVLDSCLLHFAIDDAEVHWPCKQCVTIACPPTDLKRKLVMQSQGSFKNIREGAPIALEPLIASISETKCIASMDVPSPSAAKVRLKTPVGEQSSVAAFLCSKMDTKLGLEPFRQKAYRSLRPTPRYNSAPRGCTISFSTADARAKNLVPDIILYVIPET